MHLSDVSPQGGGTVLVSRSHHHVLGHLQAHGAMQHGNLCQYLAQEMHTPEDRAHSHGRRFIELTPKAGEITIMHPFMVHTGSANTVPGTERIMLNIDIKASPVAYSRR